MGDDIFTSREDILVDVVATPQERPLGACMLAMHSPIKDMIKWGFPTFRTPAQNISIAYPFSTLPIIHSELNEEIHLEASDSFQELLKFKIPDIHTALRLNSPFSSIRIVDHRHARSSDCFQKRPFIKHSFSRKRKMGYRPFETIEGEVVVLRNNDGNKSSPKIGIVAGKLGYASEEQDDYVVKVFEWECKGKTSGESIEEGSQLLIVAPDEVTIARADAVIM